MNRRTQPLIWIMLAGVVTGASAQTGTPPRSPASFAEFDTDNNGFISEQELLAGREARRAVRAEQGYPVRNTGTAPSFTAFDSDGDGQLSPQEFAAGHRRGPGNVPGAGMATGSGAGPGQAIGRGAGGMQNRPQFTEFDLNGDGVIVEEELIEARGKRIAKRASQGYRMQGLGQMQTFQEIDGDGDGKVTLEEFLTAQAKHRSNRAK